jgi:YD repeat-containing protein
VHHTYTLRRLYTGLDGREVRVAFESATDSYAYDTSPFAPGSRRDTLPDVAVDLEGATTASAYTAPTTSLVVRGASDAHVQSSSVVDLFGNATQQTGLGCVDCSPADTTIVSHSTPAVVPADPGGWLWRTSESWVDSPGGKRKDSFFQYDSGGSITTTSAVLSGTLPLVRSHATGATVAPAPDRASSDGTLLLSAQAYDPFGNRVFTVASNERCRAVTPDSAYAELPVTETVYVGGLATEQTLTVAGLTAACGGNGLSSSATYDRGFQLPVRVVDLHGEVSAAEYDVFGRSTKLWKPDPNEIGVTSTQPAVKVSYYLPMDPTSQPFAAVLTQTQDGATPDVCQYRDTWTYTDGMGRTIATVDQADVSAGDGAPWIASGLPLYDAKGATERAYLPWFWAGPPGPTTFPTTPTSEFTRQAYDAFGRATQSFALAYDLTGLQTLQSSYHALSVDAWDAEDLNMGGLHYGTYATSRKDGHGRAVSMIERVGVTGGGLELHDTQTTYLTTGEVSVIRRTRGAADDVVRWVQYDTLGRMVLNAEPNTSAGFTATVGNLAGLKAWRYAYDDNGDLVGTSDARGCGENYAYDAGGRIVAEDYSPCLASQAAYSAPDVATGDGTEVFYVYDALDPAIGTGSEASVQGCPIEADLLWGRVASISDRGSKTVMSYDGRGRTQCMVKQIVAPGAPSDTLASRYAPRWYEQEVEFDAADRPVMASTGAQHVTDGNNQSYVTTQYSRRGVVDQVASGYGPLVASIKRDADGPVNAITYGDLAATSTAFTYDTRRRVLTVQTMRGPPASWPTSGTTPTVYQHTLEDALFHYDLVDNPIEIDDLRTASEWPAGAQPVTRNIVYDDLYRATSMTYSTGASPDAWVDPFQAEDNDLTSDPRLAQPSPHASFTNRVQSQTVAYDWLGNTTQTGDDVGGFYDRSLGTVANGGAGAGPYQLTTAAGGTSPWHGSLTTAYDGAGNLVGLSVVRGSAPCLPTGASCSPRYAYEWDEVGQLVRARRWDGAGTGAASSALPTGTASVDLQYAYDASGDRTVKTATDSSGNAVYTAYVYDALELRRAVWTGTDYDDSVDTEVPYLFAHGVRLARVHYAVDDASLAASGTTHVILELADHLGSSTIALDQATGQLVELGTYEGYGAADSDYRPEGWGGISVSKKLGPSLCCGALGTACVSARSPWTSNVTSPTSARCCPWTMQRWRSRIEPFSRIMSTRASRPPTTCFG